jgi:hypothetical protein
MGTSDTAVCVLAVSVCLKIFNCFDTATARALCRVVPDNQSTTEYLLGHALGEIVHQHFFRVVVHNQGGCVQTGGLETLFGATSEKLNWEVGDF